MAVVRDLRVLLRFQGFRRLLGVRLLSQGADGVYQVALATYVVFSPEKQTSAKLDRLRHGGTAAPVLPHRPLCGRPAGPLAAAPGLSVRQPFAGGTGVCDGRPDAEPCPRLALLRLRSVRHRGQPLCPVRPFGRAAPRRGLRAVGDGQLPVAHRRDARRDHGRWACLRRPAGRLGLRRGGRPRRGSPVSVLGPRIFASCPGTAWTRPGVGAVKAVHDPHAAPRAASRRACAIWPSPHDDRRPGRSWR